jgi:hypothetical protein
MKNIFLLVAFIGAAAICAADDIVEDSRLDTVSRKCFKVHRCLTFHTQLDRTFEEIWIHGRGTSR